MSTSRARTARFGTMALAAFALTLAACGDDSSSDDANPTASSSATTMAPGTTMGSGREAMAMAAPFGPACSAVPTSGEGSVAGMADDPVATAASNNPILSTLVGAVTAAGLGDTLNGADGITVFAPSDDAFAALDQATLDAAMADPTGLLTKVLTYHVVEGRLAPDAVIGRHTTLEGEQLTVTGSGEDLTVAGGAHVVCGNVQTANATVYVIDGVLLPPSIG